MYLQFSHLLKLQKQHEVTFNRKMCHQWRTTTARVYSWFPRPQKTATITGVRPPQTLKQTFCSTFATKVAFKRIYFMCVTSTSAALVVSSSPPSTHLCPHKAEWRLQCAWLTVRVFFWPLNTKYVHSDLRHSVIRTKKQQQQKIHWLLLFLLKPLFDGLERRF